MYKIGNDILNLSMEKDTENTPTKGLYYLFKDGKLTAKGRFAEMKSMFDKIVSENKSVIEEATREAREAPADNQTIIRNWINTVSNNSLFGGSTIKQSKNKRFSKTK